MADEEDAENREYGSRSRTDEHDLKNRSVQMDCRSVDGLGLGKTRENPAPFACAVGSRNAHHRGEQRPPEAAGQGGGGSAEATRGDRGVHREVGRGAAAFGREEGGKEEGEEAVGRYWSGGLREEEDEEAGEEEGDEEEEVGGDEGEEEGG